MTAKANGRNGVAFTGTSVSAMSEYSLHVTTVPDQQPITIDATGPFFFSVPEEDHSLEK